MIVYAYKWDFILQAKPCLYFTLMGQVEPVLKFKSKPADRNDLQISLTVWVDVWSELRKWFCLYDKNSRFTTVCISKWTSSYPTALNRYLATIVSLQYIIPVTSFSLKYDYFNKFIAIKLFL